MNLADILIVVTLLLPGVVGVAYGFLNIVFSIIAWVLSVGIALKFSVQFAPLLETWVETPVFRDAIAFFGVFLLSLLILSAVGYAILKLLGRAGLTVADRLLGLCFGICLGGAIIGAVVFLAGFTNLPREKLWQEAVLLPPFVKIAVWTEQFLPQDVVEDHGYDNEAEGG